MWAKCRQAQKSKTWYNSVMIKSHILPNKQLVDIHGVLGKLGLSEGQKIADLGVGTSATWAFAAARIVGESGTVYAVDIMKPVLEATAAKARLQDLHNIRTVCTDLEVYGACKIPSGILDVVFLNSILYQSKKPRAIIKEALRLLRPGGKMMIIDWLKGHDAIGPKQERRLDPQAVQAAAVALGLRPKVALNPGKFHFGFIFEK